MRLRREWLIACATLGLLLGCSSSSSSGGKQKEKEKADAGPPPPEVWGNQAGDVQSTWHNRTESKISTSNVDQLQEVWSLELGILGTPVAAADGHIYAAAPSGISAIDPETGIVLWTQFGDNTVAIGTSASPTYDDGMVYENNGNGGMLYALDATDGHIVWQTHYEDHPATTGYGAPIVWKDRIFMGVGSNEEVGTTANATFRGSVIALNKSDGKILWKTNTAQEGENGCAVWSTIALDPDNNMVFAGTGNNYTENPGPDSDSIFAFDMDSGEIKWHKQVTTGDVFTISNPRSPDTDFGANPVVIDYKDQKLLAAGQKSGDVYVFDRLTGDQIATRKLGGGSAFIGGVFQAIGWDGEHILAVCNNATSTAPGAEMKNGDSGATSVLFALDPVTLDIAWEHQLPAYVWSPLTIANGVVYVGAETHLEALDTSDGTKLWDYQAAGTMIGGAVVNNGRVYVASGLSYIMGHPDNHFHAFVLPGDSALKNKQMGNTNTGPLDPTFTNVYRTIIAKNCIQSQCHGTTRQGQLFMASQANAYTDLVGAMAAGLCTDPMNTSPTCACGASGKTRVVAGQPDQSLLVDKIGGNPSCGDRMPPTGDVLPDDQQKLIKDWISAGANND
jgi:polyvinyl alcohol dehydrogenase (cytochrome)